MATSWEHQHYLHEALQNPHDANQHVGEIVRVLQQKMELECRLKASEVLKGGSLGQGTAIRGDFDLDLVVYSVDISNEDMLNPRMLKSYLLKIQSLLVRHLSNITPKPPTDHGLRFSYKELEVDLLPSPYFSSANELHEFLAPLENDERRMFSCSAAKWLKMFFSKQPDQVKEYIRRAKSWRNKKWPVKDNSDGRPKSILISLLVIEAYERSRTGGAHSVTDLMKNDIRGHRHLETCWTGNGALYDRKFARDFPAAPYIIDPSNPFNNVYISGIGKYIANSPEGTYYPGNGKWTNLVKHVDSLDLRKRIEAMAMRPSDARDHVDQIVTTLEKNMPYGKKVTEIVKSGSLGQGTAIDGDFDLDLVVYFKDIDPDTFNEEEVKGYLRIMDSILHEKYEKDYQKKGCTPHTLQFSLVRHSMKLDVDLLPSPFFGNDPDKFHSFLERKKDSERVMFSCTAAKWIQDFFKKKPPEAKEYIRRAKAWRNKNWPKEQYSNGRPKSFLISLLVIKAFDESSYGQPHEVNEKVKRYVLNHSDLRIHWTHSDAKYDPYKYTGYFRVPYIIDPSNPFNNVYESGISPYAGAGSGNYDPGNGNWSEFVRKICSFDVS